MQSEPRKSLRKPRTQQAGWAVALAATAALATVALAQAGMRLIVDGKTASTDVRIVGGRPYVPLADMARAMNGRAVRHGGTYVIATGGADTTTPTGGGDDAPAAPGGANEVRGTRGRVGQMLFTGKWRFEVVGVDHTSSYDSQYLPDRQTFAPKGDTEELVVVRCRLKNGMTSSQTAMLSTVHPHNIALTDDQGASYAPMDFDKRGGSTDEGPHMLPGAQTDFAVLFSVPKDTTLKDLVFSLQRAYDDYPDGGTDVRISLAP